MCGDVSMRSVMCDSMDSLFFLRGIGDSLMPVGEQAKKTSRA